MVRYKHRYLLCEVVQNGHKRCTFPLTESQLYHNVRDAISYAHGDYGFALIQAYLRVKYVNVNTHAVLIRVSRRAYRLVLSALAMVKQIGSRLAFYRTLHVGGTIRSCQKFLAKHNRQQLNILARDATPESFQQIQKSLLDSAAMAFASFSDKKQLEESTDEET